MRDEPWGQGVISLFFSLLLLFSITVLWLLALDTGEIEPSRRQRIKEKGARKHKLGGESRKKAEKFEGDGGAVGKTNSGDLKHRCVTGCNR